MRSLNESGNTKLGLDSMDVYATQNENLCFEEAYEMMQHIKEFLSCRMPKMLTCVVVTNGDKLLSMYSSLIDL